MTRTRTLLAVLAIQLLALGALAQDATPAAEFGRASSGSISAITKAPSQLSGTLSLSHSTGTSRGAGYGGSIGGELLDDRLWFFAAAAILPLPQVQFSNADLTAIEAKATAQPVDWTTVTASFTQLQRPVFSATPLQMDGAVPSSFLSLRSTSILSDRMTLDLSVSRSQLISPNRPLW